MKNPQNLTSWRHRSRGHRGKCLEDQKIKVPTIIQARSHVSISYLWHAARKKPPLNVPRGKSAAKNYIPIDRLPFRASRVFRLLFSLGLGGAPSQLVKHGGTVNSLITHISRNPYSAITHSSSRGQSQLSHVLVLSYNPYSLIPHSPDMEPGYGL